MKAKKRAKLKIRNGASLNADRSNIDRLCFGGGRRSFMTAKEKQSPVSATKAIILVVQPNPTSSINLWNMIGYITAPGSR